MKILNSFLASSTQQKEKSGKKSTLHLPYYSWAMSKNINFFVFLNFLSKRTNS